MAERRTQAATVSRETIRKYQGLLDRQAEKAAGFIDGALASYMRLHPGAGVAETRRFTYELMRDALPNFTDLAETLSCEFMESLAQRYGWDDVAPEVIGTTDYRLVDKRLRYLAKNLAEGDAAKYRERVVDVTRYYVRRSAQDAMMRNCGKMGIRYARVPSGFETCAFCFMLASRGFVYISEKSAGAEHSYHNHCHCTIVPGAEGRTKIDGYDPEGMARRWELCAKAAGSSDQADIMREVDTRDWHWLYTGEVPKIDYSAIDDAEYRRLQERGETNGHERLAESGFRVSANSEHSRIANIDLTIDGQLWELKTIHGKGSKLNSRFNEAVDKWQRLHDAGEAEDSRPKVVVDNSLAESTLSDEKARRVIRENLKHHKEAGLDEVLYINRAGETERITRKISGAPPTKPE